MCVEITDQDAKEVLDVICSQFADGMVRGIDMELSYDHDGDECIRITVYTKRIRKIEKFANCTVGLNGRVIDVLRDELRHLYPYIRFTTRKFDDES